MRMYSIFCKETLPKFKGNRGKVAAMAGHAYLHAWWDSLKRFTNDAQSYMDSEEGATKIALVVNNLEELDGIHEYLIEHCGVSLVTCDSTTFEGETVTACLGVGPIADDSWIRDVLGPYPLFV